MDYLDHALAAITEHRMATAGCLLGGVYAAYYLLFVVRRPEIACGDPKLRKLIETCCPIAKEYYWPTWWCIQSHMQTLLRAMVQSNPKIDYFPEMISTPDGGEIKLDWIENDSKSTHEKNVRPTILFLPGLTGSSNENYILHMVQDASDLGYRSVVFNNRGTGDTILKTPRTYCAANIEDTECVINHIKEKYPDAPLMGTGISLGGMILFNYLAKTGESSPLKAGMCMSVAWDVHASASNLDKAVNYYIFNKTLAKSLVYLVEKNIDVFQSATHIDMPHVLRSESIKDFDERFTSRIFGYDSVEQYYDEASLHTKILLLAKPVLCLCASDDPFSPDHTIPMKDAAENDNIAIVKTGCGGHIGFLEGAIPRERSYMYRWFRQYATAVFEEGLKDD